MDILKYAKERHIRIIPEIDIPGHSRAAIKAMNARYRKYIDTDQSKAEEYLLIDFADTSQYLSAQISLIMLLMSQCFLHTVFLKK